jgi:hypothetical protein
MRLWRRFLLVLPIVLFLSVPCHSHGRISTLILSSDSQATSLGMGLRQHAGSYSIDITGMWLGTWKSSMHPATTGRVKASIHQMEQKVEARVELEGTVSGQRIWNLHRAHSRGFGRTCWSRLPDARTAPKEDSFRLLSGPGWSWKTL